jgi:aspartate aminotransferase
MFPLSYRLKLIKPSQTLAITQQAAELKKAGRNIISLGAGEPDFDSPQNIKEAAIEGIKLGFTKYTNIDGMPQLKQAIQAKFKRENNLDYDLSEIMVSNGGKQVIYNLFMASLNENDEVIIISPYWVSYPDIVLLAGGKPIFVDCDMKVDFKLTSDKLEQAISNKTKWIIINSPSNPTGATYSFSELEHIAQILRQHPNINIMSDDIYEHIIFDNIQFYNLANVAPDLKHRIFIVNGLSKAYAMTGWRIGYGAGQKELIKAMTMIQSQSTSNPSSISQIAAIEALNGIQDFIIPNIATFQQKRDIALSILQQSENLACYKPEGAFYLFSKCSGFFGATSKDGFCINDSNDFASYLLEAANVAVVPGLAFGLEGYFRISYATSISELEEGCTRIVEACKSLRR